MSVANVVGSNIFNVLFILGASALIAPLVVNRQLVRFDVPVLIGASVLLYVLAADGSIGFLDSLLLAGLVIAYTSYLIVEARVGRGQGRPRRRRTSRSPAPPPPGGWPSSRIWRLIVAGIAGLVLGSHLLVRGAIGLARAFGVSEVVIGLTIVAAGTGLPELATSVVAALKGARDIAIGNIIGSNIFNILSVLGFSGLASRGRLAVAPEVLAVDIPVAAIVAAACLPLFRTRYEFTRWNGAFFLGGYVLYIAWIVLKATGSRALGAFNGILFDVVFPALIIGMTVSFVLALRKEKNGIY